LTRLSSLFRRDGHEIVPAARIFLSGERADELPRSASSACLGSVKRERSPLRIYARPQIFAERFCEVAVREAVSASPARIRLPPSNHRISPISAIWTIERGIDRLESIGTGKLCGSAKRPSSLRTQKRGQAFTSLTSIAD